MKNHKQQVLYDMNKGMSLRTSKVVEICETREQVTKVPGSAVQTASVEEKCRLVEEFRDRASNERRDAVNYVHINNRRLLRGPSLSRRSLRQTKPQNTAK